MRCGCTITAAVLVGALVVASPAAGDADTLAALQAEVRRLRAENARLKARLSATETDRAPVVRVVDGDTLVVRYALHQPTKETIRLLRVDTPERGQPGYLEARAALSRLVRDQPVTLEFETGTPARGGYGRLLAYLRIGDRNLNLEMVRLGWARHYTRYGTGKYARRFAAAEREAMRAGRGLWYVAPALQRRATTAILRGFADGLRSALASDARPAPLTVGGRATGLTLDPRRRPLQLPRDAGVDPHVAPANALPTGGAALRLGPRTSVPGSGLDMHQRQRYAVRVTLRRGSARIEVYRDWTPGEPLPEPIATRDLDLD